EIGIEGQLAGEGNTRDFVTRTPLRLPVAWNCIEIFPFLNLDSWKPEFATLWAENDILAAVATQQFREAHYQSLDPNSSTRKQYAVLLDEFRRLLDSNPEREETLQKFLRSNPMLLCPTQIRMWPKLALGARKTDFVFREANHDYLLVELERSTYELFRGDG